MTIRASFIGGGFAGAAGAALGGVIGLSQGDGQAVWIYSALGTAAASLIGWAIVRRRLA